MMKKPKLVISSGAGISAESGISTFRDADGLWENYPVMDVCSADGFARNPALVHQFYNERRKGLVKCNPNAAHTALVELEKWYDVYVITQNVDNLHERAGSSKILHLHGELMKVRSMRDETRVYTLDEEHLETTPETRDKYGDPVRPHIVFSGSRPQHRAGHRVGAASRHLRRHRHIAGRLSRRESAPLCPSGCPGLLYRSASGRRPR